MNIDPLKYMLVVRCLCSVFLEGLVGPTPPFPHDAAPTPRVLTAPVAPLCPLLFPSCTCSCSQVARGIRTAAAFGALGPRDLDEALGSRGGPEGRGAAHARATAIAGEAARLAAGDIR